MRKAIKTKKTHSDQGLLGRKVREFDFMLWGNSFSGGGAGTKIAGQGGFLKG